MGRGDGVMGTGPGAGGDRNGPRAMGEASDGWEGRGSVGMGSGEWIGDMDGDMGRREQGTGDGTSVRRSEGTMAGRGFVGRCQGWVGGRRIM